MKTSTIADVTPTMCSLMGIPYEPVDFSCLLEKVTIAASGLIPLQKVLLYAPDAIGTVAYTAFPQKFKSVLKQAPIVVNINSILPTLTPVCFASMFTGLSPEIHGIQTYQKPLLRVQTLFDRLLDARKRVAVVAVRNSSIDKIFRDRPMDYYSEDYDPQVTQTAIRLLCEDKHDFILMYHQEYDDMIHKSDPMSELALAAMQRHIDSFSQIAGQFNRYWAGYNRLIGFIPDHGVHLNPETGLGAHGTDCPEDMAVHHYYGLYPAATEI